MQSTYKAANECESLAVIGFAIEATVPKMYQFMWDAFKRHTALTDEQIVFFPLHILLDDGHSDVLKSGFQFYLETDAKQCNNAEMLVQQVLDRRSMWYDQIRNEIEDKQKYKCKRPYSPFNSKGRRQDVALFFQSEGNTGCSAGHNERRCCQD
eukprot:918158_1